MNGSVTYHLTTPPPSVNMAYANADKGRIKTRTAKAWAEAAGWELKPITPLQCDKFQVSIRLPVDMRGDIDNRVKQILDLLVTHKATPDDRHLQKLTVERCTQEGVEIQVMPYVLTMRDIARKWT